MTTGYSVKIKIIYFIFKQLVLSRSTAIHVFILLWDGLFCSQPGQLFPGFSSCKFKQVSPGSKFEFIDMGTRPDLHVECGSYENVRVVSRSTFLTKMEFINELTTVRVLAIVFGLTVLKALIHPPPSPPGWRTLKLHTSPVATLSHATVQAKCHFLF